MSTRFEDMETVDPLLALRPYQLDAVRDLSEALEEHDGVILHLPVASGKTITAAAMIRDYASRGKRVLFVAHRREIIQQASAVLNAFGVSHGIIVAGESQDYENLVQLALVMSLPSRQMG
jgi:DNA repair protein RadD